MQEVTLAAFVPYLLILAGFGLATTGKLHPMAGWVLCALGVLSGVGVAATIALAGPWQLGAFAVAALPAAIALPMVARDLRHPRINDVTTDMENPLAFEAALRAPANQGRDMAFSTRIGAIGRRAYPDVRPLLLHLPAERAFERVEQAARTQRGWKVSHCDAERRRLEAEVTTPFFRFVDDVVLAVSSQGDQARVDMRSKSRDGLVDAGVNAQRIVAFLEGLSSPSSPR